MENERRQHNFVQTRMTLERVCSFSCVVTLTFMAHTLNCTYETRGPPLLLKRFTHIYTFFAAINFNATALVWVVILGLTMHKYDRCFSVKTSIRKQMGSVRICIVVVLCRNRSAWSWQRLNNLGHKLYYEYTYI